MSDNLLIFRFLAQSIASAALVFLTFLGLAPSRIGARWLDHHFDAALAKKTYQQDREIERLKSGLAHLEDRGTKSNEREFNALAAAWNAFSDAFESTMRCAISFIEHPDIENLNDEELKRFLDSSAFTENQKRNVVASTDKLQAYIDTVRFSYINDCGVAIVAARTPLRKNAIFIPEEILETFENQFKSMWAVYVDKALSHTSFAILGERPGDAFAVNGEKQFHEMLNIVRARLLMEVRV